MTVTRLYYSYLYRVVQYPPPFLFWFSKRNLAGDVMFSRCAPYWFPFLWGSPVTQNSIGIWEKQKRGDLRPCVPQWKRWEISKRKARGFPGKNMVTPGGQKWQLHTSSPHLITVMQKTWNVFILLHKGLSFQPNRRHTFLISSFDRQSSIKCTCSYFAGMKACSLSGLYVYLAPMRLAVWILCVRGFLA